MTFTALPQFAAAVIGALRADVAFMQLVTAIYDEVPPGARFPHIVVDEPFETPDRTFGQNGHQSMVTLSVFTQNPATTKSGTGKAGWESGLLIAEAALELLTDIEGAPVVVDDHDVVDVDVVSVDCTRDTDGKTRRVDVVLMATLEDAA